jgi:hypothetical protein
MDKDISALIAESTAQLDAMIAENLAAERAFLRRQFRPYLEKHVRDTKRALGVLDGDATDDSEPTDDVAGPPEAGLGEA